jgi:UDP-N-acetylglucosamine--N-acetylmuramyl-(pentapeptide) pyrophosphoryl-undecaprenol N-acetylglucosamine transferase
MNRVLVMAGGTGGHVFPALAVARALRARSIEVSWLGTARGIEARVVPAAGLGIEMDWLDIKGVRGSGIVRWLGLPFALARAMWQAARVFRHRRPQAVLSFGGFVAGPGGLVAWLTRTPLVIHEQNAIPGLTNKWLALLARRVLTGFPRAFGALAGARHVGNPVREEIRLLPPPAERLAGRTGRLRLLVVGGSQGARAFNQVVPQALQAMPEALRPEVWHQCGRGNGGEVGQAYEGVVGGRWSVVSETGGDRPLTPDHRPLVVINEFIDDMAKAYAWADVVLSRSGAMTVAELAAAGVPAILVPYPHAVDDHQTANARYLESRGAAMLLPQSELAAARLAEVLGELAANRDTLAQMARAARGADMPDAADACVEACLEAMHA